MNQPLPLAILVSLVCLGVPGRGELKPFEPTPEWEQKIRDLAPEEPPARPKAERTVLVFSLSTGFHHWCIPHTEAMVRILGEKSGAYRIVPSRDIEQFLPDNLRRYDAVVLNNNCPTQQDRDVFRDVLINQVDQYGGKYKDLPLAEREAMAAKLYASLTGFVAGGGGLILLHGAIANFNYSDDFSDMVGGSFQYHPPQQDVVLKPVDPGHPLVKPFQGKPFVHHDEPYVFNRAYPKMAFRPLLELDLANMTELKQFDDLRRLPRYVAWIRRHDQGRVFFCSPSHNAQSFEQPVLLQFILGGIQYALGDLDCPD